MIERILDWALRLRAAVLVIVTAVALWGVYCLLRTPVDAIPDLSENQVIVFADWPGHSPREMEDQVTYPLSVKLQGLAGVKVVRSTSEFNFSMITMIFDDGVDFYFARQRVLERLSAAAASLPPGIVPYLAPDATAVGQILWYTVEGNGQDLGELRSIQDFFVRYQLNSVPGVAEVASVGGYVREYQIDVDPNRLRAFAISLGDIFSAVSRSSGAAGGNVIEKNRSEYLIRGEGWIANSKDIESIVITEREGTPIFVRNVASVQLGPAPRRSMLEKEGGEVVGGVVVMRQGENPLEVTRRVKAKMASLALGLPPGVRIVPFYERTRLINAAIGTLTKTLIEEMLATAIAVFLILRHMRSSIVIIAPLPLAVLSAFICTYYLGIPANIMSLSGIAISIGVLVNAGIVMTENAYTRLYERFGTSKVSGDTRALVAESCRLVGRPIFFSVMIMVISFFPVFALTGTEGKLFRPLAYTKTFALLGVAILAVTLVPALIPLFVRGRLRTERDNWVIRSVADVYQPVLRFFLENPRWVVLAFAILAGLGWNLWPKLGHEFMPPLDEGAILDMPVTVPSVSIAEAAADVIARDALLRSVPEVESVLGKVGRADTATDPASIDMVESIVNLRPNQYWPRRALPFAAIFDATRAALPGMDEAVLHTVATDAAARFDVQMRSLVLRRLHDYETKRDQSFDWWVRSIDWELQDKATTVLADSVREAAAQHGLAGAVKGTRPAPLLRRKTKTDIVAELDTIVQVPGWANIWTQPIINRIDMLATGIRTMIGVKVFGSDISAIQCASNGIAAALRTVPGAADVFADQIVGKNYLEVIPDRERAARFGIGVQSINDTIDVALGGKIVTTTVDRRERLPVRVRYARDYTGDEEAVRRILVDGGGSNALQVPLSQVAEVRVAEGSAMLKSENGLLRSYVQLNVRNRDVVGFVEDAARAIKAKVKLPPGVFIEWGGQFEQQIRAKRTLSVVFPIVIALIFMILYLTYHDLADTFLMMLAVPGALVGGMFFQVIFSFNFSVAVWVGYIACFGLAAETGIIMLVYLREAINRAGGLQKISSLADLKEVVVKGAVQRLRPKLLTESAAILGLLPMLWSTGVGSEIMRPMAAPVLGGILIADEVIDLFIPVCFYLIRKQRWNRFHPAG